MHAIASRLRDRLELDRGRIAIGGVHALVRLLLDQRRADARRGWKTPGVTNMTPVRGDPAAHRPAPDAWTLPTFRRRDLGSSELAVWARLMGAVVAGCRPDRPVPSLAGTAAVGAVVHLLATVIEEGRDLSSMSGVPAGAAYRLSPA